MLKGVSQEARRWGGGLLKEVWETQILINDENKPCGHWSLPHGATGHLPSIPPPHTGSELAFHDAGIVQPLLLPQETAASHTTGSHSHQLPLSCLYCKHLTCYGGAADLEYLSDSLCTSGMKR